MVVNSCFAKKGVVSVEFLTNFDACVLQLCDTVDKTKFPTHSKTCKQFDKFSN